LPKPSILSLILGGAAVHRRDHRLVQYRIPPLRRTGPRFKSARPDQIPDSRYFPAAEGFRTAVFRSSAAIMR
jgi:hypothetical protein